MVRPPRLLGPTLTAALALTLTIPLAASAAPTTTGTTGAVTPDVAALAPLVAPDPVVPTAQAPAFSDVGEDNLFADEIGWLYQQGISTGWPDGTFRPYEPIARDAMAAFLFRLQNPGEPEPTCTEAPFVDVAVDNQFCGVISWMSEQGISTGWPDGTYRPLAPLARDAAMAFVSRVAGADPADTECGTAFSDVPPGTQFCEAITWAAGLGITTGYPDGTYRPLETLTREAMAAFLFRLDDAAVVPVEIDGAIADPSIGDPYYPEAGNGGYDVESYHVDLVWDPATRDLVATTTIVAEVTASERLGQITFDLETTDSDDAPTLAVTKAKVNGRSAGFTHADREVDLVPVGGLEPGETFTAQISYEGTPGYVPDVYGDSGWHDLSGDGALVMGEPASSSAWFPSNAHPRDRALFSVTATVPYVAGAPEEEQWQVSSNGEPVTDLPPAPEGWRTFGWAAPEPMATYLTTLYIDRFTSTTTTTDSGVTIYNTFAPGVSQTVKDRAARTGEIQTFFEGFFGPYPFTTNGGQYTNDSLGYALETQTRSSYSRNPGLGTIAHEIAHQWVGDNVTVNSWADMCLNECLAEYAASWLWAEHSSGTNLTTKYASTLTPRLAQPAYWARPLVDMGAGNEFNDVYGRGSLAIHALRLELGDDAFFTLLERWATEKADQNVAFSDFEDLVDEVADRDVSGFMTAWFRSTTPPPAEYLHLP